MATGHAYVQQGTQAYEELMLHVQDRVLRTVSSSPLETLLPSTRATAGGSAALWRSWAVIAAHPPFASMRDGVGVFR